MAEGSPALTTAWAAEVEHDIAVDVGRRLDRAGEAAMEEVKRQLGAAFGGGATHYVTYDAFPHHASLRSMSVVFGHGERGAAVLRAHAEVATITGADGAWLAIPTPACPRGSNRRRMTPVEVEAHYNSELVHIPAGNGRPAMLALDLVGARNGRGYRAATKRRLAAGRTAAPVVLFLLVPRVTTKKRLDLDGPVIAAGEAALELD